MSNNEDQNKNLANSDAEGGDVQGNRALRFVRTLITHMQLDAEATFAPDDGDGDEDDDEIRIEIEGPDAGRIIGKRGLVLEAVQYLTSRVAQKKDEARRHISVDAEGYRARHEDQLADMAEKLGARVAKEGKVITFDPMNARDRRVVHMAVKDLPGVRTESNGQGPDRRVQLIPDASKVAGSDSERSGNGGSES
jgi:spoIIIJ-associated protein